MGKIMSKLKLTLAVVVSTIAIVLILCETGTPDVRAGRRHRVAFDVGSLRGSYSSMGRADGARSVSVGVTTFDGNGGVTRFLRINANDGEGGRRLIDVSSEGSYTVSEEGVGVILFTNTIGDSTAEVTFDFVIRSSTRRGRGRSLVAQEVVAVQREAGITASLIEESFVRQAD